MNTTICNIEYLEELTKIANIAISTFHPVGSLYWTSSNIHPKDLFGGEWQQIKDCFIACAGDNYIYSNEEKALGDFSITIKPENIPPHEHSNNFTEIPFETSISLATTKVTTASSGEHFHWGGYNPIAPTLSIDPNGSHPGSGDLSKTTFVNTPYGNDYDSTSADHNHTVSTTINSYNQPNINLNNNIMVITNKTNIENVQISTIPRYKAYYCWERIS